MTKCGDMTYASYLMRKRGECDKGKEKTEMEVTLNGVRMEGTPDQITAIARKLGIEIGNDGVWYNSSSRGLIRITDMNEEHLRRTIAKRYREWASSLSGLEGTEFVRAVTSGVKDVTTLAMITQLTQVVARKNLTRVSSRF